MKNEPFNAHEQTGQTPYRKNLVCTITTNYFSISELGVYAYMKYIRQLLCVFPRMKNEKCVVKYAHIDQEILFLHTILVQMNLNI